MVYTLPDPDGLPLDATGVTTPGTISVKFIAAVPPNDQQEYTAYTTATLSGTAGSFSRRSFQTSDVPENLDAAQRYGFVVFQIQPFPAASDSATVRGSAGITSGRKFLCTAAMDGAKMSMIQPEWTVANP